MIHKFAQGDLHFVLDINSGAIHLVDQLVYDLLDYYPDRKDEIEGALKGKYDTEGLNNACKEIDQLIDAEQLFSEDTYIHDLNFKSKKPVVKAMCLHIAHDCNIRCAYCFASQGDFQGDRSLMSYEVGRKALDYLVANSGNRRNLEVDFFGGEPLMNFEVVKQLVEYGRSIEKEHNKNFRFTMTTNGVLLSDEVIDYCNEHMANVVLSLDGRKSVNDKMRYTISGGGTYDTIVPKFKKLVEKRGGKSYYVRGTFTANNIDFSEDVLHMADLGFKSTSVEPVVSEPGLQYTLTEEHLPTVFDNYDRLAEEMVKREKEGRGFDFFHFTIDLNQGPCVIKRLSGCGAGAEYLAVTPEGDFYPCHQFVGDEKWKLGDVNTGVQNTELTEEFSEAHVYNKTACKTCWAKFYCSGGCHANAYNFNNDLLVPYDLGCEMEKKRIECSIYIQAKKNLEG